MTISLAGFLLNLPDTTISGDIGKLASVLRG
jgi:hypothetical protein